MPLYEYVCQDCGKVLELLQPMGENQADRCCPECGGANLSKKISAANLGRGDGHRHSESGLCCGRSERPASCGAGGCCGGQK